MDCLDKFVSVKRRYTRAINLERDLELSSAVEGYIPTPVSLEILERVLKAKYASGAVRAWTITGNYGSGKSAFVHFLCTLLGPKDDSARQEALRILRNRLSGSDRLYKFVLGAVVETGLVRAVVTANREGVKSVLLRALERGASNFWASRPGPKPKILTDLSRALKKYENKRDVSDKVILQLVRELAAASGEGLLIVIDELGKILEYEVARNGAEDLHLLQQIAELAPADQSPPVLFVGLLHHSFADYGSALSVEQRNEWVKIHGRFEDIAFFESERQTIELMKEAVTQIFPCDMVERLSRWGHAWTEKVGSLIPELSNFEGDFHKLYPLHPTAVAVLPRLCARFGQNDRSLFSFLTSEEPLSFGSFLRRTRVTKDTLTPLTIADLYDYFFNQSTVGHLRPQNLQRWLEVKGVVDDSSNLGRDAQQALKTIGVLNMLAVGGSFRATEEMVVSSLMTEVDSKKERLAAEAALKELKSRGIITWRKLADELRIWQGSDVDLNAEIQKQVEELSVSPAEFLQDLYSSRPLVPHRHCYRTGAFRMFEVKFADKSADLSTLCTKAPGAIGLVVYWLGAEVPKFPAGRSSIPLVVLVPEKMAGVREAIVELAALRRLGHVLPEIQKDGVVRRELAERYRIAADVVRKKIQSTFSFNKSNISVNYDGKKISFKNDRSFKEFLSDVCDNLYSGAPVVRNELINRRELTGQGSLARRTLIEAMIKKQGEPNLGLTGNGPEVSVYECLLRRTGIYSKRNGVWSFGRPTSGTGLCGLWQEMESFCNDAKQESRSFDELFRILHSAPFGAPQGPLPILVVALLLSRSDELGFYSEGSFVPSLSPEHFELFVRAPELFSVKHFALSGIKAEVFRELEEVLQTENQALPEGVRNKKFLSVIKPLIAFARTLNRYALQTKNVSTNAQAVRLAITKSRQLDGLVFSELPVACGFEAFDGERRTSRKMVAAFGKEIARCLRELQGTYDDLMLRIERTIRRVIGEEDEIAIFRSQLSQRAIPLLKRCTEPQLTGFVSAVADEKKTTREWIEAVAMVIMDKPPESWTDTDAERFDSAMVDIYRRFTNLEAVSGYAQTAPGSDSNGRCLTLTRQNGDEIHQMVWSNPEEEEKADKLIHDILVHKELKDNDNLRRILVAKLSEHVFASTDRSEL